MHSLYSSGILTRLIAVILLSAIIFVLVTGVIS